MVKSSFQYLRKVKPLYLLILLICVVFVNAHAQTKIHHSHKSSADRSVSKKNIIKYGTASFYAKKFNGRQTANGEIYSSEKFTAACNVLPLNTFIKVTNLRNNRTVIVKVNDRLHPKNKRLVDLSRVAAQELRYISRGLTRVKIEVIENFQIGNN